MSFIGGVRPPPSPAKVEPKKAEGRSAPRGPRRSAKSKTIEFMREQIAACEKKIQDVRDAEATLKALKVALASLEGK